MDFVKLSDEQREFFDEEGYLVVENVLGAEEVARLTEAGDALFFENRIFHTKSPNLSHRMSRVVIYGYSYNWIQNGFYLENLDNDVVADLTDIEKQLLDVQLSDNPNGRARSNTYPLTDWAEEHGVTPEQIPWTVEV